MEMNIAITAGRTEPYAAATGVEAVSAGQKDGEETKNQVPDQSLKPIRDEYIPEEEHDPGGRYWMDRDDEGKRRIYFDDPNRPEICRGSTDKVDREIEKLKKEQKELEQKLSSETDETKRRELESRLEQVERKLRQKDNDTYRRQHTVFS